MNPILSGIVLALFLLQVGGKAGIGGKAGSGGGPSLNPCLISAWAMNEGSGLTLNDVSGNANTATINTGASVVWTANSIKTGVTSPVWQGTGFALASSTTLTNFSSTTPFSVSAWMKLTSAGKIFISTLTGGTLKGWELSDLSTGPAHVFLINSFPSNYIEVKGSTNLNTGALFYVVATYDGSQTAAGVKIYVNGVLETLTVANNTLSATIANGTPAQIASRPGAGFPLNGPMAFTEVYNCVLTPTQITTYNAAGPGIY